MLKYHKGQTSLEFLIIVMALLILAMFVVIFLSSSFDLNVSVYKTKNQTLQYISESQTPFVISTISYIYGDEDLNIDVYIKNPTASACPDFNYSTLEDELEIKTRFDVVTIKNIC